MNMLSPITAAQAAEACPVEPLALEAEAVAARIMSIEDWFRGTAEEYQKAENALHDRLRELADAAVGLRARSVRGARYQLMLASYELGEHVESAFELSFQGVSPDGWRALARAQRLLFSALSVLGLGGAEMDGLRCCYLHSEKVAWENIADIERRADGIEAAEQEIGIRRGGLHDRPMAFRVACLREMSPGEMDAWSGWFGEEAVYRARRGVASVVASDVA